MMTIGKIIIFVISLSNIFFLFIELYIVLVRGNHLTDLDYTASPWSSTKENI